MKTRKVRKLLLLEIAAAVTLGVLLEAAMDPFEEAGLAWIGLVLGVVVFAVVIGRWFDRKKNGLDGPDERQRAIERRASRLSHGTLALGVAALALVLTLPWVELPVATLLWALLLGSIAVHELSIERFRRQM